MDSLPSNKDYKTYNGARAGLVGVIIIPLFIVWISTIALARRRSDPARRGLTWLKACHPLLLVSLTFLVATLALNIVSLSATDYYSTLDYKVLYSAASYCSILAALFVNLFDALLVIVFVEIGIGFRLAKTPQHPPSNKKLLRIGAAGIAFVFFALSISTFAYSLWAQITADSHGSSFNDYAVYKAERTNTQIILAYSVIAFIVSIGQIALAFVAVRDHAGLPPRKSAVLYLVATAIDCFRLLLIMVQFAHYFLPRKFVPLAWQIVDALFDTWIAFIILVLLFVVGKRKEDGLWSLPQSWSAFPQQTMPPQQMAYQQQQQQPVYAPQGYAPQGQWQTMQQPIMVPQAQYGQPMQPTWQPHELASAHAPVRPGELESVSSRQQTVTVSSQSPVQQTPVQQTPVQQEPVEVKA